MYTTTNTIREWPVGLLDAVFEAEPGIEKGLPGDFDGSLDYVLSLIPRDRDREILVERYRDRLTMDAISQRHGITRERVRQIIACCLHMMRRPTVRRFLQYGVSGMLAREAHRSGAQDHFAEELADVIIMTLSACGHLGIDIDAAVRRKMEINKGRPWRHGK